MASQLPVSIGALLLAPQNYRHLPDIRWTSHGDLHAELQWQLGQHFTCRINVFNDRRLGSPKAALRAVQDAVTALGEPSVLLLGIAGHCPVFRRRSGDIVALALPGSVPGRPGSMLDILDLAKMVGPSQGKAVIVCADLISADGDAAAGVAGAFSDAVVLASQVAADDTFGCTCHDALASALGKLAAAGVERPLADLLSSAQARTRAAGNEALLVYGGASQTLVTSTLVGEQLPEFVRADLWSLDPGSRLDAVTELAALAESVPFAAASLRRLSSHDRDGRVREFADIALRKRHQPELARLVADGVIPRDVYEAASKEPQVPELVPQDGGDVLVGIDEPAGQEECRPQHMITLPPYGLSRTVVTNHQYLAFLAAEGGPCPDNWQSEGSLWSGDFPVVFVSWHDATRYSAWLTRHLRRIGSLAADRQVDLPSEAEWEAAAGSGRGLAHPWGNAADPHRANIRDTKIDTVVACGRFSPAGDTETGCQDLIGNVWEWTRSLWGHSGHQPAFRYPYRCDDGREDPSAKPGARYVIRGGAFYYATECANSFTRNNMLATYRHPAGGFRVASINKRR